MFQSRNTNPNNSHTCYSSTIIQTGTLSQDNVNPQSFLLTPRSISPNTPNNAQPHHRSSIKSSKSSKNKINFKERSQIRKTAATYANKASTYGTLFEIDPENYFITKQHQNNHHQIFLIVIMVFYLITTMYHFHFRLQITN